MIRIKQSIVTFIAQFLPPCDETTCRLSESRDRKLSVIERVKLRTHLWICDWCTNYGKQIALIDEAVKQQAQDDESKMHIHQQMSEAARQKIKKALSDNSDH